MSLPDRIRCLIPANCLLCGQPLQRAISLCCACEALLPAASPACPRCGAETPGHAPGQICGRCQLQPPPFDQCRGACRYENPVSHLITAFKFQGNLACGRALSWMLAKAFLQYYAPLAGRSRAAVLPDLLIPVPLHRRRLQSRGFNQALLLARTLAQLTGIPVAADLLERTRDTVPQSRLSARRRAANLQGAFRLLRPSAMQSPAHVAIIDDVITTTATAAAVATTLRQGGITRIDVWAAARTRQ